MKKRQIDACMKTFDEVLDYNSDNGIFKSSVNPLQTGLILYKTIQDIQVIYQFPKYTSEALKETTTANMVAILKMYKDPSDMYPIIYNPDVLGKEFFWYLNNYQIF